MRRILLLYILLSVVGLTTVHAQFDNGRQRVDENGYDQYGNQVDPAMIPDRLDSANVEVQGLPPKLYMWRINNQLGDRTIIPADTAYHHFQNTNLTEGLTGHYNYLANMGSPRMSRIFFDRRYPEPTIFMEPFSSFFVRPTEFNFTNSNVPYTNLTYHKAGNKVNGEERFKSYFSVNVNKKLAFGFNIDYLYGRGYYNNQNTAYFNAAVFGSYIGDRYQVQGIYSNNYLKTNENGGITDDRYITAPEEMPNFGKISLMKNQEGIYLAYLTDPAAIAKVLPAPLKPFSVPVVTVSVCHVKEPTFADDYYEAILGVYCTYGTQLGLYPIGLVLGGTGAEMAVQCGRDNGSIPKKLGSEFVIRRNNDHVTAQVCRRGTELVNIDLKIGEYNNAMTGMLYQFPEAGKKTYGGGFYFHLDREPDKEGKSHFQNGALLQNLCEYNYHSWEPGFAAIKLQSSIDDPWGELPIRTVIGGAYSSNDLMVHKLNLCEEIDADVLAPYLLTARYDRTAFMETGRR